MFIFFFIFENYNKTIMEQLLSARRDFGSN